MPGNPLHSYISWQGEVGLKHKKINETEEAAL